MRDSIESSRKIKRDSDNRGAGVNRRVNMRESAEESGFSRVHFSVGRLVGVEVDGSSEVWSEPSENQSLEDLREGGKVRDRAIVGEDGRIEV